MIRLRLASENDDSIVGELLVESFLKTYASRMPEVRVTNDRIRDLRDVKTRRQNAHVVVIESDGNVIGTLSLHAWASKGCEAWTFGSSCLRMMAIAPEYQGKGYSRTMVDEAIRVSTQWGAPALQLHIRRGAKGLARMYEKLGFRRAPEGDKDLLPEIFLEAYELKLK